MDRPTYLELVAPIPPASGAVTAAAAAALAELESRRGRPDAWTGRRIGLVDNSKTNALELLSDLQALLCQGAGAIAGPLERKEVSGPLDDDAMLRLRDRSDLVLVASAD